MMGNNGSKYPLLLSLREIGCNPIEKSQRKNLVPTPPLLTVAYHCLKTRSSFPKIMEKTGPKKAVPEAGGGLIGNQRWGQKCQTCQGVLHESGRICPTFA